MGLIPSLLEDSDSKDIKSSEEAEDIAALGAVTFFGKLELIQIIQRYHDCSISQFHTKPGPKRCVALFVSSFFKATER